MATIPSDGFGGGRALVIGGSLSGLLAARVLADHFEQVTVLERDVVTDEPAARKGVPQGRHVHVLLKQGERILARYFPGICDDLERGGATRVDMARDTRWFYFGNWKARFPSGLEMLCQSRPFLDGMVRRHVAGLSRVRLLQGVDAAGLALDGRGRIAGVRVTRRTGDTVDGGRAGDAATDMLAADLVVDASGRGSRMPAWLAEAGWPAPAETEVRVDVGYASRCFRRPRGHDADWTGLMIYPKPPGTRLGVLFPIEDDRWMVTLVGWFGDHPAGDEAGFLDFARSLDVPDLYDAIRGAEPVSPIALHKFPSNRRRHYERLPRLPEGLAVLGDAFCSFNPIYGQGMTGGALGAQTLDAALGAQRTRHGAGELAGFSAAFQQRLGEVIDTPWLLTTTEDLRHPAAEGRRAPWVPLLQWYTARVQRLTWSDHFVGRRFLEVMHLTETPRVLFHPYIVYRALAYGGG
ncbi:MAG TPA: FAD-dependent monooxygenase [Candidatus Binatia bacterium]